MLGVIGALVAAGGVAAGYRWLPASPPPPQPPAAVAKVDPPIPLMIKLHEIEAKLDALSGVIAKAEARATAIPVDPMEWVKTRNLANQPSILP